MLTKEILRQHLVYKQEAGAFYWLSPVSKNVKVGQRAGSLNKKGYRSIQLHGKAYQEHRLAWLYVHGEYPKNAIDHINGIKDDNRILNLRDVTQSVNAQNQHKSNTRSKTGLLGVCKSGGYYQARITLRGETKYLGTYKTPVLAHEAYMKEKRKVHEGCVI